MADYYLYFEKLLKICKKQEEEIKIKNIEIEGYIYDERAFEKELNKLKDKIKKLEKNEQEIKSSLKKSEDLNKELLKKIEYLEELPNTLREIINNSHKINNKENRVVLSCASNVTQNNSSERPTERSNNSQSGSSPGKSDLGDVFCQTNDVTSISEDIAKIKIEEPIVNEKTEDFESSLFLSCASNVAQNDISARPTKTSNMYNTQFEISAGESGILRENISTSFAYQKNHTTSIPEDIEKIKIKKGIINENTEDLNLFKIPTINIKEPSKNKTAKKPSEKVSQKETCRRTSMRIQSIEKNTDEKEQIFKDALEKLKLSRSRRATIKLENSD